jgi:hypothetical protein
MTPALKTYSFCADEEMEANAAAAADVCPQCEVLRHVHGRTKPRASPESRQHL